MIRGEKIDASRLMFRDEKLQKILQMKLEPSEKTESQLTRWENVLVYTEEWEGRGGWV